MVHNKSWGLHTELGLSLIRVLKKNVRPQQKLSDKYAGKLPEEIGERIQQYLTKNRDEWERNI